ncbi:MAG: class I SAM-dependent rRNA methyltransferase [Thermodesulfobacteriota bacterium]
MAAVTLKKGREDSLFRRHPWIFSGAVARVDGNPRSGQTVAVQAADGRILGYGAYSPHSQIMVRLWSFDAGEEVTEKWMYRRLECVIRHRISCLQNAGDDAGRLVFAESDGFPGFILDRYGEFLVCQFLSAGAESWKDNLVQFLTRMVPGAGIYERSDAKSRAKEGLPLRCGVLSGPPPPDFIRIKSGGDHFLVNVKQGHKTGFYLDQRDNRLRARHYMQAARVLDCFTYSGGFCIAALKGGADHVTAIDSSEAALELTSRNLALNQVDLSKVELLKNDVFAALRGYRDSNRRFDAVVLDPPKFAASRRDVERALRGYKDINLLACKILAPGGVLVTFSCSQHISPELLQKAVAFAALDAGRNVQILEWLQQASDHPTALNFPEANYLKGLICRVW